MFFFLSRKKNQKSVFFLSKKEAKNTYGWNSKSSGLKISHYEDGEKYNKNYALFFNVFTHIKSLRGFSRSNQIFNGLLHFVRNKYNKIASIYFVNLAMTIERIFAIINRYAFFKSGLLRILSNARSQRDAFSDDGKKKYFEIISRFFMAFYIIIVDFMGYIITNYLREDSLKNDLWDFPLNYFGDYSLNYLENFSLRLENVSLKLGNYSLNCLENVSLNYLENYSLANFFGVNNFIKLNDFVKRHLRDDFLFNRKINSKKI